jgi:outer membrane protein assembly factor BamA
MSSVIHGQVPDKPRIVIDDVDLRGAVHLPESVKRQLVSNLMHSDYAANSNWIFDVENKVSRAEIEGWPDRENQGYLGFSVTATSKTLREEPGLLHVLLTIELDEGQQKRLKAIGFRYVGTQRGTASLGPTNLQCLIPMHDGEVYNRDRLYAGLDAVSRAYQERGFIDLTYNVEMQFDQTNQTVSISVELNEGKQYTWGNIQVIGLDPKMETLLKSQVKKGSLVNRKTIEDFYRDNQSLLPVHVSPKDVKWQRDSEQATVDLMFDFRTPISP